MIDIATAPTRLSASFLQPETAFCQHGKADADVSLLNSDVCSHCGAVKQLRGEMLTE